MDQDSHQTPLGIKSQIETNILSLIIFQTTVVRIGGHIGQWIS